MALLTSNPPRIEHTGDGTTRTFTYNFRILAATDIKVYVAGVLKTLTTDYSVGGVDDPDGGDVTFTVAATPANGAKVLFIRATPATQETVYPVGSKFPSTTHERVVDKLTMVDQQLDEEIGRALKFPETSGQKDKTVDDLVALKHLRVKADASGIDMVDAPTGTVSFPVTTAQGGMGADVSVSAAEGDLLVRNAGLVFARLAKAAQGSILRTTATTLSYLAKAAQGAILKAGATDPEYLAKGNDGELLEAGASDIAWITRAAMFFKTLTTKGDLLVSTGATAQRKAVGANRTILEADSAQSDGIAWAARALGVKSVQVFTGSGTWTRPAGIRRVVIEIQGSGGGGGGCAASGEGTNSSVGGGGGAGGYGWKLLDVDSIASSTITIGTAGAGGAAGANAGGTAGATSWADGTNTFTCNGGTGGLGGTAAGGHIAGGAGGTTTGAFNYTLPGSAGTLGLSPTDVYGTPSLGAAGARSGNQVGGAINSAGGTPTAGSGSGGGGGNSMGNAVAQAGGAGAVGVIVVWEYE